jgi:hypothetical protein
MFVQLPFGIPVQLHAYSGDNWSHFKISLVNGRNEDGTQRETAVQAGFKSDHLVELVGEENATDKAVVNGVTYFGRTVRGIDGDVHQISALQVAARCEHQKALKEAKKAADKAAFTVIDGGAAAAAA